MKKEQLQKILRPIIKEEVSKVIADVLPSLLADAIVIQQEQLNEQKQQSVQPQQPRKQSLAEMIGIPTANKQQKPKINTQNPLLNEVLSQTDGGLPSENPYEGMAAAHAMPQMMSHPTQPQDYQDMGDIGVVEEYTPQNMKMDALNGFESKMAGMIPQQPQMNEPVQDFNDPNIPQGQPLDPQTAQQNATAVQGAMFKNYGSFLKKMDKAVAQKAPSNIDFTNYNG